MFNKLPGDTGAAGPQSMLWVATMQTRGDVYSGETQ